MTDNGSRGEPGSSAGSRALVDAARRETGDELYRIDTGMSAYYGGSVLVLEIHDQDVSIDSVAQ